MRRGYTLPELIVAIVLVSVVLSTCAAEIVHQRTKHLYSRAGKAKTLVRQIETAAEQCEKENGIYPPGDGTGSSEAYAALVVPGPPRGLPYLQKNRSPGPAYFVNPIDSVEEVKFRNNSAGGGHNSNRIDIWCSGPGGRADGVNNWGR